MTSEFDAEQLSLLVSEFHSPEEGEAKFELLLKALKNGAYNV